MINDTFLLRLSGNGWALALQTNYSGVLSAARRFVAASLDVPEGQVTVHSVKSGSLVISFSLNQFEPRYKNSTRVQEVLLASNASALQQALFSFTNVSETVVPVGVAWQSPSTLTVPQWCDSTCVAMIVACTGGSIGLLAIGFCVLIKFKLYYPLDFDFKADAAAKAERKRMEAEAKAAREEDRASHVSEDERGHHWQRGVTHDTITVSTIDPKHYHLEGMPNVGQTPRYFIYGQDAGADVTPHAVSEDDYDGAISPSAAKQDGNNGGDASTLLEILGSSPGPRQARAPTDERVVVQDDRRSDSTGTTPRSNHNSPRRQKQQQLIVKSKFPDPSVVAKIKRPEKREDSENGRSPPIAQTSNRVALGSLPTSPSPPQTVVPRTATTTHSFKRWSVPVDGSPSPPTTSAQSPPPQEATPAASSTVVFPPEQRGRLSDDDDPFRFDDEDVAFVDVVEVGSAIEDDD